MQRDLYQNPSFEQSARHRSRCRYAQGLHRLAEGFVKQARSPQTQDENPYRIRQTPLSHRLWQALCEVGHAQAHERTQSVASVQASWS